MGTSLGGRLKAATRGHDQVLDAAISTSLAIWAVAESAAGDGSVGYRLGLSLCALGLTLPLGWRRRYSVGAIAVIAVVMATQSLLTNPPESIWTLIVMIVAAYSVAAHESSWVPSVAAVAALGGAVSLSVLLDPSDEAVNIAPTLLVFLVVPWVAGRVFHRGAVHSRGLSAQIEDLERERLLLAREAVLVERTRIARELHDVVAHSLSVIAIQADAAEGALQQDPGLAQAPLTAIKHTARDALQEMRHLVGLLRDDDGTAVLEPQPGLERVPALADKVRATGLDVVLEIEGNVGTLSPGLDLSAYRVVQEALTNVLKHAGAAQARVLIQYLPEALVIDVSDNGASKISASTAGTGRGITGMRERVALYGGTVDAGPAPAGGYQVRARFGR